VLRELDWAGAFVATVHPSSILRMDAGDRAAALDGFVADLAVVAKLLRK
jgi:uracil-DNA glycosylase